VVRFHAWAPFKQINFEIAHEFFLFSKPPVEVWEFLLQLFVPFIASDFGQALSKPPCVDAPFWKVGSPYRICYHVAESGDTEGLSENRS